MFQCVKTVSSGPRIGYIRRMGDEAAVAPHRSLSARASRFTSSALRATTIHRRSFQALNRRNRPQQSGGTSPHTPHPTHRTPTVKHTIHSLIVSDWAPHIEKTVRLIAIPIAAVYVAGLMVGTWIHQLNDALAQLTSHSSSLRSSSCDFVPRQAAPQPASVTMAAPVAVKVQRCAVAAVPASAGILPQEPMDRAVLAVRHGMSQAAAARHFKVSRSTLRRRLK